MAYSTYRYNNNGPTKINRTSWGPVSAPIIDIPTKVYQRPLSGNYDRIINSFDRTNAFECVRSIFENAGTKTVTFQQDKAENNGDKAMILRNGGADKFEESTVVKSNSRFDRADSGIASRKTSCSDEEVAEYYQDRLYLSQTRQLFPLQEDLADWINKTIGITYLNGENFLDVLDNGVELCQLATVIRDKAKEASDKGLYNGAVPEVRGRCWQRAARRSFFSRDNMENFITFCKQLGVHENLLFESDDLVLHAKPRNVILCLLEVARIATKWHLEPPGLVQLEREIALEEAGETVVDGSFAATLGWQFKQEEAVIPDPIHSVSDKSETQTDTKPDVLLETGSEGTPSVHTDDTWSIPEEDTIPLKPISELDKRVQIVSRLLQRNCNCSEGKCSKLLKVKKVGEGRYNIAGRNVFIRLLKGRHMMVRVGGGWDTLEHFLSRHDPCQVRVISPQSSSSMQKVTTVNLIHQSLLKANSLENDLSGDISPTELNISNIESGSDTSSTHERSFRKSPSNLSKSPLTLSKSSLSGRTTPMSNGKCSPRNLQSPVNGKYPLNSAVRKMSPANLKLDLTPSKDKMNKKATINNRMVSPVESSNRLLPPTTKRSAQTPTGDGKKSFPTAVTVSDVAARRRSLNLSTPVGIKTPRSNSKPSLLKSPQNIKTIEHMISSPVTVATIENSVKMAMPISEDNSNKAFLHIRGKYRSPPPRDVPPR